MFCAYTLSYHLIGLFFDGKTDDKTMVKGGRFEPTHHLTMVADGAFMGFVETETKEGLCLILHVLNTYQLFSMVRIGVKFRANVTIWGLVNRLLTAFRSQKMNAHQYVNRNFFSASVQSEAIKRYFEEHGVKTENLTVLGCDGEVTNTGWRVS